MPPNTHTLRPAWAPAARPRAPGHAPHESRADDDPSRPGDVALPGEAPPERGVTCREDEALLARYAALARRAHALFAEPMPDTEQVPEAIVREFEDAAHQLGPYVSAMPGARALSGAEFHALRAFDEMLESDGPRDPAAKPAPEFPATDIRSISTEPVRLPPRWITSLPTATMPRNISGSVPAIVISSTG